MQRKQGSTHRSVIRRLTQAIDARFLYPITTTDAAEILLIKLDRLEDLYNRLDMAPGHLTKQGIFLNSDDFSLLVTTIAKYDKKSSPDTIDADFKTVTDIFLRNRQQTTCTLVPIFKPRASQLYHTCDPLALNSESRDIFESLLTPTFADKPLHHGFYKLITIDYKNQKRITYFQLTETILIREDKYGNIVADIVDLTQNRIGIGCESVVFMVHGTLKRRYSDDKGIRIEWDDNKSVVKIKSEDLESARDMIVRSNHEYEITAGIEMIRQRKPLYEITQKREYRCYATQRYHQGETLEKLMVEDFECLINNKSPKLSIRSRYELIIALFRAVQYQVTEHKIVHNDLTFANVLMTRVHGKFKLTVIDRGFSNREGEIPEFVSGTPAFITHERTRKIVGEFSDVASTALLASLFFRNCDLYNLLTLSTTKLWEVRNANGWVIKVTLDQSLTDLPQDRRECLTNFFNLCTSNDIKERPSIQDCIVYLEDEYHCYKTEVDNLNQAQIIAINKARSAARKFRDLLCRPSYCRVTLDDLYTLLAEAKETLPDLTTQLAYLEFIYILDLECMLTATDKQDILEKLDTIVSDYHHALKRLEAATAELLQVEQASLSYKPIVTTQLSQLNRFRKAHAKVHCHLDAIVSETAHIERKCDKMEKAIAHLKIKTQVPQDDASKRQRNTCTIL